MAVSHRYSCLNQWSSWHLVRHGMGGREGGRHGLTCSSRQLETHVTPQIDLLDFNIIGIGKVFWRGQKSQNDRAIKEALYIIQILCRRYTFWSYPAGLTIADPPG